MTPFPGFPIYFSNEIENLRKRSETFIHFESLRFSLPFIKIKNSLKFLWQPMGEQTEMWNPHISPIIPTRCLYERSQVYIYTAYEEGSILEICTGQCMYRKHGERVSLRVFFILSQLSSTVKWGGSQEDQASSVPSRFLEGWKQFTLNK